MIINSLAKEVSRHKLIFKNNINKLFKKMLTNKTNQIHKNDYKLFDIAANLCDEKFQGIYNGKKYHEDDTDEVIERAKEYGVQKMLFASGSIEDLHLSFKLTQKSEDFYTTIGIHPCRASEAEREMQAKNISLQDYFNEMYQIYLQHKDKIIAIGECGLDYDRFHYSSKEDQLKFYQPHFELAEKTRLPMYLHSRNTDDDFYKITKENRHKFSTGVVHSFTESEKVLNEYLSLDLYIGVNGCSLKTQENCEVVKKIPLDRILLETDAPYCDIRNTHASAPLIRTNFEKIKKEKMKKGLICKDRNEPCMIVHVLEAVAKLKNISEEEMARIAYENSMKVFNL